MNSLLAFRLNYKIPLDFCEKKSFSNKQGRHENVKTGGNNPLSWREKFIHESGKRHENGIKGVSFDLFFIACERHIIHNSQQPVLFF